MKIPNITIQQLLEAGVHLGHKTLRWNPKMKRYIFGKRDSIHIIDLTQTLELTKSALESLTELKKESHNFDIIFIDADKYNYQNYYNDGVDLVKKEGLIIIDNVLWHGEVANINNNDKLTNTIRDFNQYIKNDNKTEQVIIPLGDGLMVCRKI